MNPRPVLVLGRSRFNYESLHPNNTMNVSENQERGLTFREVYQLVGLRCKTSHTARNMAKRGQIRAIQLNGRVTRYSLTSVRQLLGTKKETAAHV